MRRHALALALALLPSLALAQQINDVQLRTGSSALWGAALTQSTSDISQFNTSGSAIDSFRWFQGSSSANSTFLYSVGTGGSVFGTATGGRQGAGTINAQGLFVNGVAPVVGVGGSNGQVQYNNAGVLGGITGATTNGTALTLVAPVLGTPASGNLANTTGYALGNLTGAGAGCLTWLGTPSSANLRGCLSDETGTGLAYFQGGDIGTPSAGVGSNLTALNATQLTTGTVPGARLATATKADQQAGSSTTLVVTPSQQQSHDSAAKAWATWTASTGAILSSYNVTSVIRNSAGTYTITFTTAFASANYVCDVNVVSSGVLISQTAGTPTTTTIVAFTANTSGVGTDATGTGTTSIVCFGRQ